MQGLASTAIYLASSLTTAQASGAVSVPVATPTITVPASRQAAASRSANDAAVGNPFVEAQSRGAKSLDDAIADLVRRDARDPSVDDGIAASSFDLPQDPDDQSLGEDVTAAHDARIGFIRRRMDELRLEGASAAPQLTKLGVKLHFAIAAQRLAAAREAIGHLPAEFAAAPCPDTCRPAVVIAAVTRPRSPRHGRRRPLSAMHHGTTEAVVASSRSSSDQVAGARARSSGAETRHAANRPPLQVAAREAIPDGPGDASAKARRLLAKARHLLEDGTGHDPRSGVKLAGLLHWEGSETWSLASYPRSAA